MEFPGQHLKKERELREISLSRVHEDTRIPLRYLEAIEADDYEKLPHATFIKGFIRCYAKYLGIDENDSVLMFELYLKEHKEIAEKDQTPEVWKYHPDSVRKPSINLSGGGKKTIAMLAVAGIILIIVLYVIMGRGGESVNPPVSSVPAQPETVAPKVESQAAGQPVQAQPAAQPAQAPAPALKPSPEMPAGQASVNTPSADNNKVAEAGKAAQEGVQKEERKHVLQIKATERTWLKIKLDNDEPFDLMLQPGEAAAWKARSRIAVVIGNAGGVNLSFNGKKMAALGKSGDVVHLSFPQN